MRVAGLSLTGGSFAWWGYVGDSEEDPALSEDMLEVVPVDGGLSLTCSENWSLRARYCVLGGVSGGRVLGMLRVIQRGATLSYPRSVGVGAASGSVGYVTFTTSCTVLGHVAVRMVSGTAYTLGSVEAYGGGYRFSVTSRSANTSFTTGSYGTVEVVLGSGALSLSFRVSVYQVASAISEYTVFGGSSVLLSWGDSVSGTVSDSGTSVTYGSAYASEVRLSPYSGVQGSSSWYSWYDVRFEGVYVTAAYTSGQTEPVLLSGLGSDYAVSLSGVEIVGGTTYRYEVLSSEYSAGVVTVRLGFPWLRDSPASAWSGVLTVGLSLSRGGVLLASGSLSYNGFTCAANTGTVISTTAATVLPSPYPVGWESGDLGKAISLAYTQSVRWTSGFEEQTQVLDYDVTVTLGLQASDLFVVETRLLDGADRRVSLRALTSNRRPWSLRYTADYGCSVTSASGITKPVSLPVVQSGQGWSSHGSAFYFKGVPADEREKYNIVLGSLYLTGDASAQYNGGVSLPADAKQVPGNLLSSWDRSLLKAVPFSGVLEYPDTVGFTFTDTCYMLWGFILVSSAEGSSRCYQSPAGLRFGYDAEGSTLGTAIPIEPYNP